MKEVAYCTFCRGSHTDGRKHKYRVKHKANVDNFLKLAEERIEEVNWFAKKPQPLGDNVTSTYFCPFCEISIHDNSEFTCEAAIRHLSDIIHEKNVRDFLKKHCWPFAESEVQRFVLSYQTLQSFIEKCKKKKKAIAEAKSKTTKQAEAVSTAAGGEGIQGKEKENQRPAAKTLVNRFGVLQNPTGFHNGKRVWGGGVIHLDRDWQPWPIDLVDENGAALELPVAAKPSVTAEASAKPMQTAWAIGEGLTSIVIPTLREGEGNIHTGGTPPWLMEEERSEQGNSQEADGSSVGGQGISSTPGSVPSEARYQRKRRRIEHPATSPPATVGVAPPVATVPPAAASIVALKEGGTGLQGPLPAALKLPEGAVAKGNGWYFVPDLGMVYSDGIKASARLPPSPRANPEREESILVAGETWLGQPRFGATAEELQLLQRANEYNAKLSQLEAERQEERVKQRKAEFPKRLKALDVGVVRAEASENWVPSFGAVWHYGTRGEAAQEFREKELKGKGKKGGKASALRQTKEEGTQEEEEVGTKEGKRPLLHAVPVFRGLMSVRHLTGAFDAQERVGGPQKPNSTTETAALGGSGCSTASKAILHHPAALAASALTSPKQPPQPAAAASVTKTAKVKVAPQPLPSEAAATMPPSLPFSSTATAPSAHHAITTPSSQQSLPPRALTASNYQRHPATPEAPLPPPSLFRSQHPPHLAPMPSVLPLAPRPFHQFPFNPSFPPQQPLLAVPRPPTAFPLSTPPLHSHSYHTTSTAEFGAAGMPSLPLMPRQPLPPPSSAAPLPRMSDVLQPPGIETRRHEQVLEEKRAKLREKVWKRRQQHTKA